MSFAVYLIDELKKAKGIKTDKEIADILPKATKGWLSSMKKGDKPMTEEQALFIANECELNPEWVLVCLAEQNDKNEDAKAIWHNLAKKLTKSINATILVLSLVFCGFGDNHERNTVFS